MSSNDHTGAARNSPVADDWWVRPDRYYDGAGLLRFAGRPVSELGDEHGTPTYFYSEARIAERVALLQHAIARIGMPSTLFYAMKSNRHPAVLELLRTLGLGIDVCSPGEMRLALQCGFAQEQLSFTAGCLGVADYEAVARAPRMWVNADSLTALRHLAEVCPGREVGLRINPGVGLGYRANDLLRYAGERPTKFGVYLDRFEEAVRLASSLGLRLTGLHCHAGCGFLTPQLPALGEVFERIQAFLDRAPHIERLNLGGGLGIPLVAGDCELELGAWADLVRARFATRKGLRLAFEPGDFLVKDAGLLLVDVTQVEEKGGRIFVGVNAGFNVHVEPAFYRLPLEPVPVRRREGQPMRASIVGNINEALDVWCEETLLAPLEEGDRIAFLNAGGYGASMSSQHCLRNEMKEVFLTALEDSTPAAKDSGGLDLSHLEDSNKRAWDRLYATTADLVWGHEELPFLTHYADAFRDAGRGRGRFLDAGTGEGRNLPFLLRSGASEVHAIDASSHALAKIVPAVASRVHLKRADLDATGYPGGHFDGIVLMDVVETLPAPERVLRELARVLRPGGVLLCNIPGPDDGVAGIEMTPSRGAGYLYRDQYYFEFRDAETAKKLVEEAGLEVLAVEKHGWDELPHPGFRSTRHRHVSVIILARRSGLGQ